MKRFLRELGASFSEGKRLAWNKMSDELSPAQLAYQEIEGKIDSHTTDDRLVDAYFDFLSKFPAQRVLQQTDELLDRIIEARPGTVAIINKRLNKISKKK